MKHLIAVAGMLLFPLFIFSQDITGLWIGTMINDSAKTTLPYELLIKKEKGKYTGYSKNYFLIRGEEYYGIKKVKVSVAKDGKIVIKDFELLENNYPAGPDKNVQQLNILDLVNQENEKALDGLFVTNLTKRFGEVTGHINIKKMDPNSESSLMKYLQKKSLGNEIAVAK